MDIHSSFIHSSVIQSFSKHLQVTYTSNIYWVFTMILTLY